MQCAGASRRACSLRSRLGAALDGSQRSPSLRASPRCAAGYVPGGCSRRVPDRSALAAGPPACKMCETS